MAAIRKVGVHVRTIVPADHFSVGRLRTYAKLGFTGAPGVVVLADAGAEHTGKQAHSRPAQEVGDRFKAMRAVLLDGLGL